MTSGNDDSSRVGGQAVIEGVMMKSPFGSAVAVRKTDGGILARHLDIARLSDRGGIWKKPVFRGAATLIDTLRLGLHALNWSAEAAEDAEASGKGGRSGSGIATVSAVAVAVVFFAWLPLQLAKLVLPDGSTPLEQFYLHLVAGGFRFTAFLLYIWGISFLPDVRRLFTYHGAEHQTIHAYEKGLEPLEDQAVLQSPLHQRCGTSFLLLVMLATVVFYAILDSVIILLVGVNPSAVVRILYHIPLIPFVMGFSYEILRVADRHLETSRLARIVTAPGLFLQRLTTRKAGREEVEVALASLRVSLDEDPGPSVTILEDRAE
jgi:uncharacterized protein YqhQ